MRDIRFRAWDEARFTYFNLDDLIEWGMNYSSIRNQVIMQYTGLKDKNGKEIYEGDIIQTSGNMVYLCRNEKTGSKYVDKHLVIWDNAGFAIRHLKNNSITHSNTSHIYFKKCEIIGNIYESPKLLQGDNNA